MDEKPVLIVREGQLDGQRWTIDEERIPVLVGAATAN